jgi:hypothetical protein
MRVLAFPGGTLRAPDLDLCLMPRPEMASRGLSSAGRASDLHSEGHRFDPDRLHQGCSASLAPLAEPIELDLSRLRRDRLRQGCSASSFCGWSRRIRTGWMDAEASRLARALSGVFGCLIGREDKRLPGLRSW